MGRGCALDTQWDTVIRSWRGWLRASGLSDGTIRLRVGHVAALARATGARTPQEFTTEYLVAVMGSMDWSLEHRRAVRTSLVQFYDYLAKLGRIAHNPALGLPRIPQSCPRPRPASDLAVRSALESAGPRERLMLRLAVGVGLRRAEIASLHTEDVISDSGWSLRVVGKGRRQRIVPVADALAAVCQEPPWATPTGYVFPGLDRWGNVVSEHLSPDRVGRLISELLGPGLSAHSLRHTYATKAFAGTHNLRVVQEVLGHASVATTQRYTAVTTAEVRAVLAAVGDA